MASIRSRVQTDGSVKFAVLFRERATRKQTSLTYASRVEAERMAAVIEANGGDLRSAQRVMAASKRKSPLVRDVVLEHISMLTAVAPGQLVRYRNQVRDHLSGPIGVTPVDNLDIKVISGWIQEMQRKGLSAKTIKNVHGLLSAALKTAAILGYREDNPCRGVPLPKSTATDDDMRLLTHAEARLIIDAIPEQYRLLIRALLATGMRWGEATALKVSDLDLASDTGSVRISRAWRRGGDGEETAVLGPTKTRKSRRTVALADDIADQLRVHVADRRPDDFVFVNSLGSPVKHHNFWRTCWRPAIARAQRPESRDGVDTATAPRLLRTPRIHDLRHTHASWMIAAGADLMTVQRRLGHESIQTTVDRYSHLLPEQHAKSAKMSGLAMRGL